MTALQFILYLFLGPEARYISESLANDSSAFERGSIQVRRIDSTPLTVWNFVEPISSFRHSSIVLPTVTYTIVSGFRSILLVVRTPIIFLPLFGFNPP